MSELEERTCKTCCHFNEEAYYCRARDTAVAEWDSCDNHETYEERRERVETPKLGDKLVGCISKDSKTGENHFILCAFCHSDHCKFSINKHRTRS